MSYWFIFLQRNTDWVEIGFVWKDFGYIHIQNVQEENVQLYWYVVNFMVIYWVLFIYAAEDSP